MQRPWILEQEIAAALAQRLVEESFPELAPARVALLGEGWDNSAYLVNGRWVFRFPRRAVAVELIETECAVLPELAPRLPLPIPVPTWLGAARAGYPWPFAGYESLPGQTACRANLDARARTRIAAPLGRFLRALHDFPPDEAARLGAGPDKLGRLDVPKRREMIVRRLADAERLELIRSRDPWLAIVEDVPEDFVAGGSTLAHGDLYARHLLVGADGMPCGVIDWGDVHLGDPAVDLSMARGFLPPTAHDAFRDAYGPIDDSCWRVARFRALLSAVTILVYGDDIGDDDLLREGRFALDNLASGGP